MARPEVSGQIRTSATQRSKNQDYHPMVKKNQVQKIQTHRTKKNRITRSKSIKKKKTSKRSQHNKRQNKGSQTRTGNKATLLRKPNQGQRRTPQVVIIKENHPQKGQIETTKRERLRIETEENPEEKVYTIQMKKPKSKCIQQMRSI